MELQASGLPSAIQTLTREMVDRARVKALLSETDIIAKHLKDMRSVQAYVPPLYSQSSFDLFPTQAKASRGKTNQG